MQTRYIVGAITLLTAVVAPVVGPVVGSGPATATGSANGTALESIAGSPGVVLQGNAAIKWNGTVVKNLDLYSPTTHHSVVFPLTGFSTPTAGTLQAVVTSTGKWDVIEGLGVYAD